MSACPALSLAATHPRILSIEWTAQTHGQQQLEKREKGVIPRTQPPPTNKFRTHSVSAERAACRSTLGYIRNLTLRPPPTRLHRWCATVGQPSTALNHYQSGLWEAPTWQTEPATWRAASQLAQPMSDHRRTFGPASRSGVERSLGRLRHVT